MSERIARGIAWVLALIAYPFVRGARAFRYRKHARLVAELEAQESARLEAAERAAAKAAARAKVRVLCGPQTFEDTCDRCGTHWTYESDSLIAPSRHELYPRVECPTCGQRDMHPGIVYRPRRR